MDWIKDPSSCEPILWLYGPAGAGKSAIAQTIAELAEEAGKLGATLFFSRGAPGRGTADQLFTMIAHQLADNLPEISSHIGCAMETKPHLPTKSQEIQFRELIANPASQCIKSALSRYIGIDRV